jgi:hypothetical protein
MPQISYFYGIVIYAARILKKFGPSLKQANKFSLFSPWSNVMHIAKDILEVLNVEVLDNFSLQLQFNDGTSKTVSLRSLIQNAPPMFEPLKQNHEFKTVNVNPVGGVSWNCGADLSADYLKAI